jgi:hypothetical protein
MLTLLYTHENRLIVSNLANILEHANISVHLKNEYAGAAAGDIVPHETWLEIWVDEMDFDSAMSIIEKNTAELNRPDWQCKHCGEFNPVSFELCWQCGRITG